VPSGGSPIKPGVCVCEKRRSNSRSIDCSSVEGRFKHRQIHFGGIIHFNQLHFRRSENIVQLEVREK